jgi:rhodanese-related sulfurtransferase
MRKWLLMVAIGIVAVVVVLSVAVVALGYVDERRIDVAARATPEIGPSELSAGGAAAAMALGLEVNPSTVDVLRDDSDVVVVDVRTPSEYASGHIPGTISVPLDQISERTSDIPPDKGVLLVCRSGNRSAKAAHTLGDLGYENVHSMRGGIRAWTRAGYPLEP